MSARVQAVLTGQTRTSTIGPEKLHEMAVVAVTRRIVNKQRKLRQAQADIKRLRAELRHDRRELRAYLQRDSRMTEDQPLLEVGGQADGVDRSIALAAQRRAK